MIDGGGIADAPKRVDLSGIGWVSLRQEIDEVQGVSVGVEEDSGWSSESVLNSLETSGDTPSRACVVEIRVSVVVLGIFGISNEGSASLLQKPFSLLKNPLRSALSFKSGGSTDFKGGVLDPVSNKVCSPSVSSVVMSVLGRDCFESTTSGECLFGGDPVSGVGDGSDVASRVCDSFGACKVPDSIGPG